MRVTHGIPAGGGAPVALTIGNFDGVHLGHQAMLARLASAAAGRGVEPCVLTFEPHPREFFAPDQAPTRLTSLREKLELLAAYGVARAHVCRFDFDFARITAEDFVGRVLVRGLAARWIMVGDDFRFGARRAGDIAMMRAMAGGGGYAVEAMPTVEFEGERVSSTVVREALAAGELARAAGFLGRPYSISGRVTGGERLGRVLGFPTANVQMKHNRPPVAGIFAVEVHGLGPAPLPGAASLGLRPTVAQASRPTLEVHLIDFDRAIYGAHVRVDFLHKLRDEEKYADVETLRRQIALDVANVRRFFAARASAPHAHHG